MAKKKFLSIGGLADFWVLLKEKFDAHTTSIATLGKRADALEGYSQAVCAESGTQWIRVLRFTSEISSGIIFLTTGLWNGKPRVLTISINNNYSAARKHYWQARVLAGDTEHLYGARTVKEDGVTYVEFRVYTKKVIAKAYGLNMEIVPGIPVVPDTPAEGAEVTDLEIIRESDIITNEEIDALVAAPSGAAAVALADTTDAEPEQTAPEEGAVTEDPGTIQEEDSLNSSL